MKKLFLATAAVLSLALAVPLSAEPVHDWPDLKKAHEHIKESIHEMERVRAANHYDMAGHGVRAEELLRQAEHEIHEAIEAAHNAR